MQKVIMLHRIPGVKRQSSQKVCFLSRKLCSSGKVFQKQRYHAKILCQNAEDGASTFAKVTQSAQYQDIKHFIFW